MTTYYVDATDGNDSNDGLSTGAAWQTIGKVNGATFSPGDSILFKRGETWSGTTLTVPSSGSAGNSILVADYGTGNKPIFDGSDTVDCIDCGGHNYLTFQDLECTQGFNFGIICNSVRGISVIDCECHDCGNDQLIFINVCQDCLVQNGLFYNGYARIAAQITGIEVADGSHDILIEGARCYSQQDGGAGISIHSHAATEVPYNITIQNCACYDNTGMGIRISKADNTADTDRGIVIQDNAVYDNSLDGITATKTGGATNYLNGVDVLRNNVYSNTRQQGVFKGDDILVCKNIFSSDVAYPLNAADGIGISILNNTIYATADITAFFPALVSLGGARLESLVMKNNIVEAESANPYLVGLAGGTGVVGINIDYNLYRESGVGQRYTWLGANKTWPLWLADSGQDANSPTPADPLFQDVANDRFELGRSSPALNVGTSLTCSPFYGSAPDCGRWEMRWPSLRTHAQLSPRWQ